ncbi:MAG: hypothetical protein J3R72DRAFT_436844, partial [Linnemannia gamsii]
MGRAEREREYGLEKGIPCYLLRRTDRKIICGGPPMPPLFLIYSLCLYIVVCCQSVDSEAVDVVVVVWYQCWAEINVVFFSFFCVCACLSVVVCNVLCRCAVSSPPCQQSSKGS